MKKLKSFLILITAGVLLGSITGYAATVLFPYQGGTGTGQVPTNGQLLIGSSSVYYANTLTAGANITITNGTGTITIAGTGGGTGYTNTTTTVAGLNSDILLATSTGLNFFTISTSSQTITFNLSNKLNTIHGLATTTGGLIVGNGATWGLLGVGTDGKVLTASSTATNGVSWETVVGGVSSVNGLTGAITGLNIYNTTTTLSGLTGNILVATGTAGNDVNWATSSPTLTLNIPTAGSAVTRGLLTSADWTTFNNKQATISANAPIQLNGAALSLGLTYATSTDNTATKLYFSTTTSQITLNVPLNLNNLGGLATTTGNVIVGSGLPTGWLSIGGANLFNTTTTITAGAGLSVTNGGVGATTITNNVLNHWTLSGNNLYASSTGYNIGIGTTTPGSPLHVVGSSTITASSSVALRFFNPITATTTVNVSSSGTSTYMYLATSTAGIIQMQTDGTCLLYKFLGPISSSTITCPLIP